MKGKIIELYPDDEKIANEETIKVLEDALEVAKEGTVVNCGIVLVHHDQKISYAYSNHYFSYTLVGVLRYLEKLIMGNEE